MKNRITVFNEWIRRRIECTCGSRGRK
ncbi:hypothetical protein [Natranaerobius trueperi]|uniref:Uncharacterized protein n=1 Tax=Natranaerobius trueperi TaxID=759412 RepID=A0A226BW90_9FIRM|nr:hypothetical protein CDO51_09380 [Natranaerobius trueperi]